MEDFDTIIISDEEADELIPGVSMWEKWSPTATIKNPIQEYDLVLQALPHRKTEYVNCRREFQKRENVAFYAAMPLMTRTLDGIVTLFSSKKKMGIFATLFPAVIPSAGSSVSRALWIGLQAEFRNIVLVGVDLLGEDSFSTRANPDSDKFNFPEQAELHRTARKRKSALPIQDVVKAISDPILKEYGTQLWVGHSGSLLSNHLPVFSFQDER